MTALLQLGLLVLLLLFSVPVVVFVLQLLLASDRVQLRRPTQVSLPDSNKLWALLIPAHNEMDVVAGTLVPLLAGPVAFPGRVLVVADNCTDDTAALCRHLGAEVVERFSATERGKGYALQYGLNHLASDPLLLWWYLMQIALCLALTWQYLLTVVSGQQSPPKVPTSCTLGKGHR